MMSRTIFSIVLLALLLVLFFSVILTAGKPAHAQASFPFTEFDLALEATPDYPSPGQNVRFTVRSVLLNLATSDITWYVNGAVVKEGAGLSEMDVVAGPLGSEKKVRVEVRGENEAVSVSGIIRPTEVELLWEADSYVPPFYRGRALPSAGSHVLFFALPRFQRPGASLISPSDLLYTWRKNGKVIQSASGRGKHTVLLDSPVLFGSDVVSVEVSTADGELRGLSSVRIASVEPLLVLYENHSLFGILYHRALGNQVTIPEVEATFSAVPYFAPVKSPDSGSLLYKWRVNNFALDSNTTRPSAITINATGSSGRAFIELALTHATNFFMSASGSWNVTLSNAEGINASDPFGSQP